MQIFTLETMKRLGEVMRSRLTVLEFQSAEKRLKKVFRVQFTLHYSVPSTIAATSFSLFLYLEHIVYKYILYISMFQTLNLNLSSHWFWTCAFVSFFSSSCLSSFSPSSFSFSCCDGGQRRRRSCLNWRKWYPEASAAAAGSWFLFHSFCFHE